MSYKITITKKETVKRIERGESFKVGQKRTDNDEGYINGVKDVYERMPDREYQETEEREIYRQEIDEINLVAIINSVNGGK